MRPKIAALLVAAVFCILLGTYLLGFMPGTAPFKIKAVERQVAAKLKNPETAKFRNVSVKEYYVCGEVDGANGFGVLAGFRKFYGDSGGGSVEIEPDMPAASDPKNVVADWYIFEKVWADSCADSKPDNYSDLQNFQNAYLNTTVPPRW